ncbi:hypothetical protein IE077_002250, partial [Cardiosporidium cionae]
MHKLHPEKEWWKEKVHRPQTFMGFPDITKADLRGGSLYIEKMDPITLIAVLDKCLKENIKNVSLWADLCWRAHQICHHLTEPFSLYIFRAFSRGDWYDHYFFLTYLGKMQQRLHSFRLRECAYVVEAMSNPKFCESRFNKDKQKEVVKELLKELNTLEWWLPEIFLFLQQLFDHAHTLVTQRSDVSTEDICYFLGALRVLDASPLPLVAVLGVVYMTSHTILEFYKFSTFLQFFLHRDILRQRDLRCIKLSYRSIKQEYVEASLSEMVRIVYALALLQIKDRPFFRDIRERVLPLRYKLQPTELASILYGFGKGDVLSPMLSQELEIGVCTYIDQFSSTDLCLSLSGFLMGPSADRALVLKFYKLLYLIAFPYCF